MISNAFVKINSTQNFSSHLTKTQTEEVYITKRIIESAAYVKPEYVVIAEHGGGGASVAVPIVRKILNKILLFNQHNQRRFYSGAGYN